MRGEKLPTFENCYCKRNTFPLNEKMWKISIIDHMPCSHCNGNAAYLNVLQHSSYCTRNKFSFDQDKKWKIQFLETSFTHIATGTVYAKYLNVCTTLRLLHEKPNKVANFSYWPQVPSTLQHERCILNVCTPFPLLHHDSFP